jgi:hypothetical protein
MTTLLERNQEILRRVRDLRPAAERIEGILRTGKREQLLSGQDAGGIPFVPLARSTLERPRRSPTPLVPDGADSDLVVGYVAKADVRPGQITIRAGWPGLLFVRYLRSGTRRMPARDPGGFRAQDLEQSRKVLREFLTHGR